MTNHQPATSLPVPMMVYGFWEGVMTEVYKLQPTDATLQVFKDAFDKSEGYSEMRKIGEAIDTAQKTFTQPPCELPSGIELAQNFMEAHVKMGLYAPVCLAWVPDDIRPRAEEVFQERKTEQDDMLSMACSLTAAMAHANHPAMMRDLNTVLNCVMMQEYRAGMAPQKMSDILNEVLYQEQKSMLYGGVEVTPEQEQYFLHNIVSVVRISNIGKISRIVRLNRVISPCSRY
jgi:hypothetical protein